MIVYHLTDEDRIFVPVSSRKSAVFLLKVWRRKCAPCVVLVSQSESGPPPSLHSAKIAHWVLSSVLRYPANMNAIYLEQEWDDEGVVELNQLVFDFFGNPMRPMLRGPIERHSRTPNYFSVIGITGEGM